MIKNRPMFFMVGLFLAAAMFSAAVGAKNKGKDKSPAWNLEPIADQRGPIRTADLSKPLGTTASTQILGGPTNGSDDGYLLYTRMPAGAHGPAMFTLPVDHLYFVLSGKMTIQIGTDKFVAGPDTGVLVPAGVPHEAWNAETGPEANLEVISPASSRDLLSMLTPAAPRKIDNAAQYVKPAPPLPAELRPGLNGQQMFNRSTGSANQMRIDSSPAGTGNDNPHIHHFEQVYFVKEGTMTLRYGLAADGTIGTYKVPVNSFVIIPPGVVHGNKNEGSGIERHVVWLLPEPAPGTGPLDVGVDFKPIPTGRGGRQ